MAVKFFRMSEKGTIKRPTLLAIGCFMTAAVVTMAFLINHPFLCIFIAWPIEYLFFAILLSSPFRIFLGKMMHWSRYPVIVAIPTKADKLWLAANMPVFKRTGLSLYTGEPISRKAKDKDGAGNKTSKRTVKGIKVRYQSAERSEDAPRTGEGV